MNKLRPPAKLNESPTEPQPALVNFLAEKIG